MSRPEQSGGRVTATEKKLIARGRHGAGERSVRVFMRSRSRPQRPRTDERLPVDPGGQNIKYISTQLGHTSVKIIVDPNGHLFDDQDFNRLQVGLL